MTRYFTEIDSVRFPGATRYVSAAFCECSDFKAAFGAYERRTGRPAVKLPTVPLAIGSVALESDGLPTAVLLDKKGGRPRLSVIGRSREEAGRMMDEFLKIAGVTELDVPEGEIEASIGKEIGLYRRMF